MQFTETCRTALLQCVAKSNAPGAVACLGQGETVAFLQSQGLRQREPNPLPASTDTVYDLASLTKVVATATAAMKLIESGELSLDADVTRYLPVSAFRGVQVQHLLAHTAGFPAYDDLYREVTGPDAMIAAIAQLERGWPPGARRRYSDFGFILLGRIVELAARDTFDAFCAREIFTPLGMADTAFNPAPALRERAAATELCPWRGRMLVGEVHDENAHAMGGVSGHAGLFSTAPDLAKFCAALLGGRILREDTLDLMLRPQVARGYRWQGFGWKLDGWMDSNEGYLPSRASFGHTGWTGTSLWLDRDTSRYAILLGNTCHPNRATRNNPALRKTFHVPVSRVWYAPRSNAQTGLDRLVMEDFDPLRGRRIALLTNNAAIDAAGRHILDLFRQGSEMLLTRIYSPEHGLRGQAEAGAAVADEKATVPVTSLYGDRAAPTPDELKGIEHFVIDLPDAGSRYYTYAATMRDCMKACAAANVPVTILDRPNPLGGMVLEGPVAQVHETLVCAAPIPARHGMTLGELALLMHARLPGMGSRAPMINRVDNWPRELTGYNSGLPWVAPSPNLASRDALLLYVGNCLFEGVNINEGRGTYEAFTLCGAPWLNPDAVLDALDERYAVEGRMAANEYARVALPGRASKPEYMDQLCRGIRFELHDRDMARPFMLTVALLRAIEQVHGEALQYLPFFDTLAGGPWLREQLQGSASLARINDAIEAQCQAFAAQKVSLYPDSNALIRQHLP